MTPAQAVAAAAVERYQIPSIAVAVLANGKVVDGTPSTLHIKYGIGSLTKQFVAAEILLLEQRHKTLLDQTVGDYFGPGPAATVTIRELLSQQSGIGDYNTPAIIARHPVGFLYGTIKPKEIAGIVLEKPLVFAPGSQFAYSNSNYLLLGLIAEKVRNLPLADALRRDIFDPLGMNDTALADAPWCTGNFACAYSKTPFGVRAVRPWTTNLTYAAGGMYSTASDLARWDMALLSGRFRTIFARMIAAHPGSSYGFALYTYATTRHRTVAWHDGTLYGFKAVNSLIVPEREAVVVLTNADYVHAPIIAMQIESQLFNVPGGDNEPLDVKLPRTTYPLAIGLGMLPMFLALRGKRWWIPALLLSAITYVACVYLL